MPRAYPADLREWVLTDCAAGVATDLTRTHAGAPRGQRAYGRAPAGRWRRLTVLGALAADGVAGAMSIERTTDTAVCLAYLDRVLTSELVRTRPGAVVVLDDLSPRRAAGAVRAGLAAPGSGCAIWRAMPRSCPGSNRCGPSSRRCCARRRRAPSGRGRRPRPTRWPASRPTTPVAGSRTCGYPLPAN